MFNGSLRRAFGLTTPTTPGTLGGRPDPFDDDLSTNRTIRPALNSTDTAEDIQSPSEKDLPPPPYGDDTPILPSRTQNPRVDPDPVDRDDAERRRRRRPRRSDALSMLQPIVESTTSFSSTPGSTPFTNSVFGLDMEYAKRMEETGRLRRLQSQQRLKPKTTTEEDSSDVNITSPAHKDTSSSIQNDPSPASSSKPTSTVPNNPLPTPPADDPSVDPTRSHVEELEALKFLLDSTLSELKEAKSDIERLKAQHIEEKQSLLEKDRQAQKERAQLVKENSSQAKVIQDLKVELANSKANVTSLNREKRGWHEKLDSMHQRMHRAERQVRCLDHVTRAKLQTRQNSLPKTIKRGAQPALSKTQGTEIVQAILALNEEILQTANLFVENLTWAGFSGVYFVGRATDVVGEGMTSMMQTQAEQSTKYRLLLMQVVLEVFMVHWTSAIIEGWYPKQQSFADVLLELSAPTKINGARVACGTPIQIVRTESATQREAQYRECVKDILDDLTHILLVGKLEIRAQRADLFALKILALVKTAYDLRSALAEKDLCGGMELSVIAPDAVFQHKWMEEAHATTRARQAPTASQMDRVAGTSGLGLQIPADDSPRLGGTTSSANAPTIMVKPKVVLLRVLQENP